MHFLKLGLVALCSVYLYATGAFADTAGYAETKQVAQASLR